jgi:hypothetical protein
VPNAEGKALLIREKSQVMAPSPPTERTAYSEPVESSTRAAMTSPGSAMPLPFRSGQPSAPQEPQSHMISRVLRSPMKSTSQLAWNGVGSSGTPPRTPESIPPGTVLSFSLLERRLFPRPRIQNQPP